MNIRKRLFSIFSVLVLFLLFILSPASVSNAQEADRVYVNGNIYTVDEEFSKATAFAVKDGDRKRLEQTTLMEALALHASDGIFIVFHDRKTNLEYIRRSKELAEKGLYTELGAFQYHILLDWREVVDSEKRLYANLCEELNGQGVPNIDEAALELYLKPVLEPFRQLIEPEYIRSIFGLRTAMDEGAIAIALKEFKKRMHAFVSASSSMLETDTPVEAIVEDTVQKLQALIAIDRGTILPSDEVQEYLQLHLGKMELPTVPIFRVLYLYNLVHAFGYLRSGLGGEDETALLIDECGLERTLQRALDALGTEATSAEYESRLITILSSYPLPGALGDFEDLMVDPKIGKILDYNTFDDVLWFNKEALGSLIWWIFTTGVMNLASNKEVHDEQKRENVQASYGRALRLSNLAENAEYRVERVLELLAED